jgi:molybdopterin-synthase adenylyltransferase
VRQLEGVTRNYADGGGVRPPSGVFGARHTSANRAMRRPKIKEMHNPVRLSWDRIRIGGTQYGVAAVIDDDRRGTVWRLLGLMDGSRTTDEIVDASRDLDEESVRAAIATLVESGFAEDAGADPPPELSPEELERYDRSAYFFGWVDEVPRESRWTIQSRLKAARVTVVGLGGAGSSVAAGLVATGIGSVHCVDFDVVARSNLNRQLLYDERDIGQPKVERAVARLQLTNSDVTVTGDERVVECSDDVAQLMVDQDLVFLCADRPAPDILLWTNDAAVETRTPWVACFYNGPMAVTGVFVPFDVPCFRCVRHHAQEIGKDGDLGEPLLSLDVNAVIAPSAAITGHLAVLDGTYFLGGLRPQTLGKLFHFNLIAFDHCYFIDGPFWDDCPACGQGRAA